MAGNAQDSAGLIARSGSQSDGVAVADRLSLGDRCRVSVDNRGGHAPARDDDWARTYFYRTMRDTYWVLGMEMCSNRFSASS
jgi:hypothetical protein